MTAGDPSRAGEASPVARYVTASHFEEAVRARLRKVTGPHGLDELRRQFAYQRLLARVFADPASPWVLKGATSLLVRYPDARHSLDVDLFLAAVTPVAAVDELRRLGTLDLGDFFRFVVGAPVNVVVGVAGVRAPVDAYLGARVFARFPVDVVTEVRVTGPPDVVRPEPLVDVPGLVTPPYRLYPIADHVADKVCAMVERHGEVASTRYRDLVDLVLIAQRTRPRSGDLAVALRSELARRGLAPVGTVPGWTIGYAEQARRARVTGDTATLDGAMRLVRAFVDPVLTDGIGPSVWSPATASWEPLPRG